MSMTDVGSIDILLMVYARLSSHQQYHGIGAYASQRNVLLTISMVYLKRFRAGKANRPGYWPNDQRFPEQCRTIN